jgi:hypothetical protein
LVGILGLRSVRTRVEIELVVGERKVAARALVNSGFESEGPDIGIPVEIAKELGIWPLQNFTLEEVQTAGGKTYVYAVLEPARVRLLLGTSNDPELNCNLVVDPHLDEVILSDYLTDELGIVILSLRKGSWRHRSDPESLERQ